MLYNMSGNVLYDPSEVNMELDYAYDSASNANYSVIRVFQTKRDGTKQYPFVRCTDRQHIEDLVAAEGWSLAINAGVGISSSPYYDGLAIQNGVVIHGDPASYHAGSVPLTIDADGVLGTAAADATGAGVIAGNVTSNGVITSGIVSAICGFTPIIVDYKTTDSNDQSVIADVNINNEGNHFTQNAQRQIIGQWANGDYAIVTCAGRSFDSINPDSTNGWTMAEAQTICQKLGLKFAYNLDGGTSTATYLRKKPVWDFMHGQTRVVPSFIVFNGTTQYSVPGV